MFFFFEEYINIINIWFFGVFFYSCDYIVIFVFWRGYFKFFGNLYKFLIFFVVVSDIYCGNLLV